MSSHFFSEWNMVAKMNHKVIHIDLNMSFLEHLDITD